MRRTYAEILSARPPRPPRYVDLEVDAATALGFYTLDAPLVRLAIVLLRVLGTGARLADEIGSPDLGWSTIGELLEALEHGAWPGAKDDLEILAELETHRQRYDLVRRTLDRLAAADVEILEVSGANALPREGERVYKLALRAA
jgi:hypothetical protein